MAHSKQIAALMSDKVVIQNNTLISGLSPQDCLDGQVKSAIDITNLELDNGRTSGVGAYDLIESLRKNIKEPVKSLRTALVSIYGIDPARLDAIADPIWQNVQNRYDVKRP